tara:strand:+ start:131 stop:322 length:192 start_codon:yes stop_codon:yes gene_type:complete
MRLILVLLVAFALNGCSFVVTAAGSFVGNLGAELVEEEMKKNAIEKMIEEDQLIINKSDKAEI